jgi:hypothetical protein
MTHTYARCRPRSPQSNPAAAHPASSRSRVHRHSPASVGFDFSRIPVHPPAGRPGSASGKAGAGAADDETADMPITGDAESVAPSGAALAGAAVAAAVGAAPFPGALVGAVAGAGVAAAAAIPMLTKSTVKGPTAGDCGMFGWTVQWKLTQKTTKGGWVVQKVELARDVKDSAGKALGPQATPNVLNPAWYPVWEAWQIHRDQDVTTYAEGGDVDDDTYGSGQAPNTKGTLKVTGTAQFYEGLTLPAAFKVTNKAPTWILPATSSAPALAGGTGTLAHNVTATWDCSGTDKTTKVTPT